MALPALSSTTQLPHRQPPPLPPPDVKPPHQIQTRTPSKSNLSIKQQTYHQQPVDPTVSWTSSISRLCRSGRLAQAATLFTQMRLSAVEPNHVTFITLLSACADFPKAEGRSFGPMVHAYVRKLGLDRHHVMVGTALVKMYGKCGEVERARVCFDELEVRNSVSWNTLIDGYMRNDEMDVAVQLFDEMPQRDAVSWTLLIDGFVKKGYFEQALESFREMQVSKAEPDYVTIISVLAAIANCGALGLGLWIHRYVLKQEFRDNIRISNSLIDMYARCGCVELARQVFDKMLNRTLVSWNSLLVGLAGALTACSHAGFIEEGQKYFNLMTKKLRISPRIEHYGCMVDLHSRAGNLEAAIKVIETMPMKPNEVILGSLLTACRTHEDTAVAEKVTSCVVDLQPDVDSNYVILANLYAGAGKWEGASKVRRKMKALGIRKTPGFSSIEVGPSIHEFVAGDKSHADAEHIYGILQLLSHDLKLLGYDPQANEQDVYQEQ
ncbi:unnamed protein product [Linum tenue]|uniref:Uncharacterized protein n=1 Tax=Linum tenue TaxID=586396 RepID=A0AAV0QB16_9ROSI|nr:unnamed protein product [Linum tenue]